jgi:hypothetical protein
VLQGVGFAAPTLIADAYVGAAQVLFVLGG